MLTDQHKKIISATVPLLKEKGDVLTNHFYNRMFAHHPELKKLFNMGNQKSGKQQTALAMAVLAYAENINNPMVLMPVIDTIGHKHSSLNVQPEQYEVVGKHLLASIEEVLKSEVTEEVIEAWSLAYKQLADLMIRHEKRIYDHKKTDTGNWMGWRRFIVKSKIEESSEISSFYLKAKDGKKIPLHIPGQYLSIKIFIPEIGLEQIRQYSISCAPNEDYFRISVKQENGKTKQVNGMISNFLHNHIQEGDEVFLSAPAGNFLLKTDQNKKVFISGGIGQTPLLSMLEALDLDENMQQDIVWIHACRDKSVHAFSDKIKYIQNNHSNVRKYQFYDVLEEQEIMEEDVFKGHIDFNKISNWEFDPEAQYYICGPKVFIEKIITDLTLNQIGEEQIFFEEFGPKSI